MTSRTWVIDHSPDRHMTLAVVAAIEASPAGHTVRIGPPGKSNAQRAKFHVLCEEIGKSLGYSPGEIKQLIKQYHYGTDLKLIGKSWYRIVRSTEDDDKTQYTALIEAAMRWGAENGVEIEKM